MTEIVITSTLRESMASIAAGICTIWEADADTPAVYAEQARIHAIDLAHSLMAHTQDGRFVGIGILCRRGEHGFVLDFGIAPPFRGQGYGHRLFSALMGSARQAGLRQVTLQVSADNRYAQQIYCRAGFQKVRELATLRRKWSTASIAPTRVAAGDLEETLVARYRKGYGGQPGWERALPSLLTMADTRGFATGHGFLLAHRSPYHPQVDVLLVALDDVATPDDLGALCYAASTDIDPQLAVALPDEQVDSPLYLMLRSLGFRAAEQSFEMLLTL